MLAVSCVPEASQIPVVMGSAEFSGVILVVEDPFIRKYVCRILGRVHDEAIEAEPRNVASILESSDLKVRLIVTNEPQLFVGRLEEIPLVYTSAFPDLALAARFRWCQILRKPFLPQDLLRAVNALAPAKSM